MNFTEELLGASGLPERRGEIPCELGLSLENGAYKCGLVLIQVAFL